MVPHGFHADGHIEEQLAKLLPNAGLKASPHVELKMKKIKNSCGVAFEMLNTSGFGWNDEKKVC